MGAQGGDDDVHVGPDMLDHFVGQWRRSQPDYDVSPMETIGRISRAALILDRHLARAFAEHGLAVGEFDLMATLLRSGPPYELSAGTLLSHSMVTSGAITHRLNRLEGAGLVERRIDPRDRRAVLVRLTTDGLDRIRAAARTHFANESRLLAALSADQRTQVSEGLRVLLRSLGDVPHEHTTE